MCVYVNGTTNSVLYKRSVLISGVSFKRGTVAALITMKVLGPVHAVYINPRLSRVR